MTAKGKLLPKVKNSIKGIATVEYILILPAAFACIFVVINIFLALYQQSLLQSLAENMAESLSRQWNYGSLDLGELKYGVYQKDTFGKREIYWNIKLWENDGKEGKAKEIIETQVEGLGVLKAYEPGKARHGPALRGIAGKPVIQVDYKPGFPSSLSVHIKTAYRLPGLSIMSIFGLGDSIMLEARAEANVYDAKDMINTTDYVVQLLRKTKIYEQFRKIIEPLKGTLDKILNH